MLLNVADEDVIVGRRRVVVDGEGALVLRGLALLGLDDVRESLPAEADVDRDGNCQGDDGEPG